MFGDGKDAAKGVFTVGADRWSVSDKLFPYFMLRGKLLVGLTLLAPADSLRRFEPMQHCATCTGEHKCQFLSLGRSSSLRPKSPEMLASCGKQFGAGDKTVKFQPDIAIEIGKSYSRRLNSIASGSLPTESNRSPWK